MKFFDRHFKNCVMAIVLSSVYLIITVTWWILDNDMGSHRTLLQIVAAQWHFIASLRIW